jgi:hypothetical protein
MPAFGRKKACNIKLVIFMQGCWARLPGKAAGQCCRARMPGKAAGQGGRARLKPALYVRTKAGKNENQFYFKCSDWGN